MIGMAMKYIIVVIVFLILSAAAYAFGNKYIESHRKRYWFNFLTFDALFALSTLAAYYMAGAVWYVILLIIALNMICISFSGWYLFTKIIFRRRNTNYEQL